MPLSTAPTTELDTAIDTDALDLLRRLTGDTASELRADRLDVIRRLVGGLERVLVVQRTGWGESAVHFIATRMPGDRGAGPTLLSRQREGPRQEGCATARCSTAPCGASSRSWRRCRRGRCCSWTTWSTPVGLTAVGWKLLAAGAAAVPSVRAGRSGGTVMTPTADRRACGCLLCAPSAHPSVLTRFVVERLLGRAPEPRSGPEAQQVAPERLAFGLGQHGGGGGAGGVGVGEAVTEQQEAA
jgi:hypothetical protein